MQEGRCQKVHQIDECQKHLINLSETQGYLTFDDILDASDAFQLSVSEVDRVSEALQLRGIIVYEQKPESQSSEEIEDYSRVDYETIFSEVIEMDESMQEIVNEIRKCPPPQYGEVRQLIMQIRSGNMYARDRMINIYLRNVLKVALSMTKQYDLEISDAFSTGVTGLMTAIDRFDPSGFSAFHSYASMWIQQSIQRNCNPRWMEFYYPVHAKDIVLKIISAYKDRNDLELSTNADFAWKQKLSNELQTDIPTVEGLLNIALLQFEGKVSLEEMLEEDNIDDFEKYIVFTGEGPEDKAEKTELRKLLNEILNKLTDKEKTVICMRNGYGYDHCFTLEEIGQKMNVTRERIRQIEAKVLRKMNHPSIKRLLDEFFISLQ